ncbi:beta-1,6-N-acetylglucosaminyltransferase [uncultured Subdoligranulum sp.]|uniref:beta-1,6-N-acetylglucosaminyltransferase n=1 Tax=uncultured Subdoligranulum sp. TaxID=512298 RepID=UPI0025E623D8|nr:beta-1,6-N-acetylglucosaminyltransferase [uncultured Subdoligranulum sp.]
MGKHAYLVIAHNEFEILGRLLSMLDDKDNDIYLHIDKKVKEFDERSFQKFVCHSPLIFIENKVDVQWGNFSQIECELRLLEEATKQHHDYYHLLSGVDLPLKSQKEIHDFFEKNKGIEFVQFKEPEIDGETLGRVAKYHFFAKRNKRVVEKILDRLCLSMQFWVDRTKSSNLTYQKGANWFSITHDLALFVVQNRSLIEKYFKYTICGDEMFLQTLVASSSFINKVVPNNYCDNYENICYCIDWKRGSPYVYREEDYEFLMASQQLFARKFSWNVDRNIIEKIYSIQMEKKKEKERQI